MSIRVPGLAKTFMDFKGARPDQAPPWDIHPGQRFELYLRRAVLGVD